MRPLWPEKVGIPAAACRRLHHRRSNRVGIGRELHEDRPTGSTLIRVDLTVPIFNTAEGFQNRLIVPGIVACFGRKVIPVVLVSPRPCHCVDAGTPPRTLPMAK